MWDLLGRYRIWVVVAVMLSLPALSLALGRGRPGRGPVDRALIEGMAFLQAQTRFGLSSVEELWEDYANLRDLKQENERLRLQVARYEEERTRLLGVLQENARLRRMLDFKEARPDLKLRPARVIGLDSTPSFRVMRVQLDTRPLDFAVQPQMPVVSHEGLVGQVIEVYDNYADVMLVSDPRSRVDVVTQRTRTRGIVLGLGHKQDYLAELAYLRRKDEVAVEDQVVTSGKGGVFPQELLVGRVADVEAKGYGLQQEARVEPVVDFGRLEEVFIITGERASGLRP